MRFSVSLVLLAGCFPEIPFDREDRDSTASGFCTYYVDSDRDGWGDASAESILPCGEAEAGYVEVPGDCDDTDPQVYPNAPERCDGLDNDCDFSVDEDVQDIWYADADGDSYGDPTVTTDDCDPDEGWVADDTDCDDLDPYSYPGAQEVCDGLDNDCDGLVDDDAQGDRTWYGDLDGDGHAGTLDTVTSCERPEGYFLAAEDCDDQDPTVNPDAAEVCDGLDNDCDDLVDDDDELAPGEGTDWYADVDGDGYGDPANSRAFCDGQDGWVANSDDCDDGDATDTDGDGTQDCADADVDGDGLRNAWDADPYDDAVARGPNAGLGTHGAYTISTSTVQGHATVLENGASAGDTTIDVDDSSVATTGEEVLVLSQQGDDAGTFEFVYVASAGSGQLTVEPPLAHDYGADSVVLVQRVLHFTTLDVSSTLSAVGWEGGGGGVVVIRATGAVTISGSVDVNADGFEGGPAVSGNDADPEQGESYEGPGSRGVTSANAGGGGAYPRVADSGVCGGGGSYGTQGDGGDSYTTANLTDPGHTYGASELGEWFLGSGGGAGTPDDERDGHSGYNVTGGGGDGGGIVALYSGTSITVSGSVRANGANGGDAYSDGGELGGGGGGSGGQILLAAPTITISGEVAAVGGEGGHSDASSYSGSSTGGAGGDGWIRLLGSVSGSTDPSASTGSWED